MAVDLDTLEVGDSVKLRSEETATVNWISKNDYGGFKVFLFMVGVRNDPIPFNDDWYKSGIIQFSNETDNDIVEIIKNPKQWQWTDDDMKEAFNNGALLANEYVSADGWLEQYKATKFL